MYTLRTYIYIYVVHYIHAYTHTLQFILNTHSGNHKKASTILSGALPPALAH